MDTNTRLSKKQQAMIPIAAFTASGDLEKLKPAMHEGLDAGLTVNEIKEIPTHLYAYAGFPRALNGLGAFMTVLDERRAGGITDEIGRDAAPLPTGTSSLELGEEVQTTIVGRPVAGPLYDFAPAMDRFLKSHLFGELFGRDVLDYQDREIATLSALSNMDGVEPQLKAHFGLSLNVGLTEGQIRELLSILGAKVDRQKGLNAEEAFREVLQEKGDNRKGDNEVKTLIVFFSHSGNTRRFARVIQEMTGGDIAEIQPVEPYPGDYDAVVRQAKRELGAGFKPPIRTLGEDIGRYGTVFLGSPNWWSTIAPPLQAFLSGYDLSGKTIIPFITHGGGGAGRSFAEIAALCPNSTVLEGLAVFGGPGRDNRDEASAWLARFGIVP